MKSFVAGVLTVHPTANRARLAAKLESARADSERAAADAARIAEEAAQVQVQAEAAAAPRGLFNSF